MRRPAMLLLTPLFCLTLATCHDTLGPTAPRGPRLPPRLVTVEDTLVASGDTHISKSSPNQNFGSNGEMRVGGTSRYRALVQFDSAAIRQAVGAGRLDSARVEFTIIANPDGFGSGGRQVDLHRLTRSWTELGATWNCPVDANTANSVPDCPGASWDMTNTGQAPYVTTRTARVSVTNGQTGVIRLDVTQDVAGFLAGTVHQGWIFRKYNESENGQALVLSRTTTGPPRLILAVTADTSRPAVPDHGYWADSAYLATSPLDTNFVYFRRQLLVTFDDTTSGATINNLLQRYQATIVGGIKLIKGYNLQFPDPGPGFASLDSLRQAIKTEPGVDLVDFVEFRSPPPAVDWLHPGDGLNLGRIDWSAQRDTTWALRAIGAPLAWGCETGMNGAPPVRVGVIEWDFDPLHPDLAASSPVLRRGQSSRTVTLPGAAANINLWHGTAVAGALTAQGNNAIGVPGVIWRSDLRLYALGSSSSAPTTQRDAFLRDGLQPATNDSVAVLNLSMAISNDLSRPDFIPTLVNGIRAALDQNPRLLIVGSTGNEPGPFTEAQLQASGGSVALKLALIQLRHQGYAPRILFVTGSQPGNQYNPAHTYLVGHTDLAAPSGNVALLGVPAAGPTWTGTGGVLLYNGTSFAAPLVAGIAASLLARNPMLTPQDVKNLILDGADSSKPVLGQLPAGATPIHEADAYGALRLLAERPSAGTPLSSSPLCGNAVWVAGGQLKARRGNSIEVVATLNDSAGLVNVLHGGRRVDVYADLGGKRSFLFDPSTGGWAAAPNPYALPDTLPGGTFIGALWASHDGDSTVSVVPAPSGIPGAFEVRLRTGGVITKTWTVSAALANTTHWEVTRRDWWASDSSYHDTDSAQAGTIQTASARPAFSPEGRRLLVALNREQHQLTVSPTWTVCPGSVGSNPPSNCRTQQTATSTLPNEVWEIPLPPGSPHPLGTSGGTHIFWLGEAEDGGRLVSGTGVHQASATVTPLPGGGWQTTITSDQWLTCTVEFRQTASLAFLNSELSAEACSPFEAAGSFAPLRAGGAGPGTVPRPPRRGRR